MRLLDQAREIHSHNVRTIPTVTLTLDINEFKGTFPDVFDKMSDLQKLYLVGNGFTGTLPASLATLSNLEELFLGENGFSGTLPAGMAAMGSMRKIYLHDVSRFHS